MKKILIFAIAALAFVGCSKEGGTGTPGGDLDNTFNGDQAWFSLSLSNANRANRALNEPNPTAPGEDDIKSVRVILFNGTDPTSATAVFDKTFATADLGNVNLGTTAFQVPATAKTAVIIANPIAALPSVGEDSDNDGVIDAPSVTYKTFNAARAEATALDDLTDATNGFMMTNSRGTLEPIVIHATEAAAKSSPTAIYINRVVSKVRLTYAAASGGSGAASDAANVSISDVQWVLNVTNKKYFPISERVKSFTPPAIFDFHGSALGSYRIDPNYNHAEISGIADDLTTAPYTDNYAAYTSSSAPSSWITPTISTSDSPWKYCLENTQNATGNVHAYTTQALIQAKYAPSKFYLPTNTIGNPTGDPETGGDWLMINVVNPLGTGTENTFYTQATLAKWIEAELTSMYAAVDADPTNTNFPMPITTAYNNFLGSSASGSATKVTIPARDVTTYSDPADQAAVVVTSFTTHDATVKDNGAASDGIVSYYKGGVSYYKVLVKHDNNNIDGDNQLGEFGVVRNSQYDIKINKFNKPGLPTIPDPDVNTPDEDSLGYLNIEIKSSPWNWYVQEENL